MARQEVVRPCRGKEACETLQFEDFVRSIFFNDSLRAGTYLLATCRAPDHSQAQERVSHQPSDHARKWRWFRDGPPEEAPRQGAGGFVRGVRRCNQSGTHWHMENAVWMCFFLARYRTVIIGHCAIKTCRRRGWNKSLAWGGEEEYGVRRFRRTRREMTQACQ